MNTAQIDIVSPSIRLAFGLALLAGYMASERLMGI